VPVANRLESLVTDFADTLFELSRGRGYNFDYGDVVLDCDADWDAEKDYQRPRIFVMWMGPEPHQFGGEQATQRFRRNEKFRVSVAVKNDGSGTGTLFRQVYQDMHKALFVDRVRGSTRVMTFDSGIESLEYLQEGGVALGGIIRMNFTVRWDHNSGDMTSQ